MFRLQSIFLLLYHHHQYHRHGTIIVEVEENKDIPKMKDPLFEFSDGYGVMRTIRLILFIQIIAICLDNPSTQYSILYRISCRGVLFYAIRFYSRPFIDVLYLIQVYSDIAVY